MESDKRDHKMIIKKLQRYVERDKFRKVSKLLSNHGELVNAILSRKSGKTGLHLACKMGCYDTARVLIKRGADVSIKDSKKSLALHYAACFCLSKKRHSRNLVSDLVSPLIAGSLASLDEANSAGITCRSLLDALNSRQERSDREKVEAAGLAVQDDDESEDIEAVWRQKLEAEAEDDLSDFVGSSSRCGWTGGHNCEESEETYDEWADRIYNEFMRRRRPAESTPNRNEKSQPSTATRMPKLENSKQNKEEPRRRCKIENLYKKFCDQFLAEESPSRVIAKDDFPFTTENSYNEIISAVCGSAVENSDAALAKKAIRDELRKWHPDKFMQKYGSRLREKDRASIESIVTHISQALIQFGR